MTLNPGKTAAACLDQINSLRSMNEPWKLSVGEWQHWSTKNFWHGLWDRF